MPVTKKISKKITRKVSNVKSYKPNLKKSKKSARKGSKKSAKKRSKVVKKVSKIGKKGSKKRSISKKTKKRIQKGGDEKDVIKSLDDVKTKQAAYDKALKDLEPAVSKLFNNYKVAINKTSEAKNLLKDVLSDDAQNAIKLPELKQIKEYNEYLEKYNRYKTALQELKQAEINALSLKYSDEEYLANSQLSPAEKTIYTKLKEKISPTFAKQQAERASLMNKK